MSTTTTPPATVPASSVIPFPTPWSGGAPLPGCCPPGGGMEALNKCYWEIQQAQAFLSAMMIDLFNNSPQVQAAMVAGILKSGLPVPTTGVTNGAAAVAGQVGEVFTNTVAALPYGTVYSQQTVQLGILPAGDWLVWLSADTFTSAMTAVTGQFAPLPAGFSTILMGGAGPVQGVAVVSKPGQALTSVASALQVLFGAWGSAAGTCSVNVLALRIR